MRALSCARAPSQPSSMTCALRQSALRCATRISMGRPQCMCAHSHVAAERARAGAACVAVSRPHACIGAHRSQQCGGVTGTQAAAERMRLEREINTLREQHRLLAEEKMRYRPAGVLFISAARMRANAEAKACGGAALCLIESAVVTTSAAAIRDDAGSASPRGCCVTARNGTIPLHVNVIGARNRSVTC